MVVMIKIPMVAMTMISLDHKQEIQNFRMIVVVVTEIKTMMTMMIITHFLQ
jgi:hypothetical protein